MDAATGISGGTHGDMFSARSDCIWNSRQSLRPAAQKSPGACRYAYSLSDNPIDAMMAEMTPAMRVAQVTGLRQCDVCVVCQGGRPPDSIKCPMAVQESWLLDLAASFEVPEISDAYDAQQPSHRRP